MYIQSVGSTNINLFLCCYLILPSTQQMATTITCFLFQKKEDVKILTHPIFTK